ncbi:MAG: phosphate signaling complex protein PhoU [bacterium]
MALSLLKNGMESRLEKLFLQLTAMGGLVENQLSTTIMAVENRDLPTAIEVIATDADVDTAQEEIEQLAAELLGANRLDAAGVRQVITAMKIAICLERIGDLARNVCKRMEIISQSDAATVVATVVRMGRVSLKQLSDALNSLSKHSPDAALAVWGGDDQLDELYNSIFREILNVMAHDPTQISSCTHMIFAAKNFERVGDHATNIAENVYFKLTGDRLLEARPKRDETSFIAVDSAER